MLAISNCDNTNSRQVICLDISSPSPQAGGISPPPTPPPHTEIHKYPATCCILFVESSIPPPFSTFPPAFQKPKHVEYIYVPSPTCSKLPPSMTDLSNLILHAYLEFNNVHKLFFKMLLSKPPSPQYCIF